MVRSARTHGPGLSGYLTGETTILRPLAQDDLPALGRWDDDPEIVALMGRKLQNPDEGLHQWFRRVLTDRSCRVMAIEDRAGRLIGEVELDRIDWRTGAAEVRICIGQKEAWGLGHGTDAMRSLLRLAFGPLGLRTAYLRVYQSNIRAVRCYERCGFTAEGVLRPSRRRDDPGEVLLMSVTRERFLRHQGARTVMA